MLRPVTDARRLAVLREHAEALRASRRGGIQLRCTRTPEAAMSVGHSRIGGRPDLPGAFPWPVITARKLEERISLPLAFVAQIALRDVAQHDVEHVLPLTGVVSIFVMDELRLYRMGLRAPALAGPRMHARALLRGRTLPAAA